MTLCIKTKAQCNCQPDEGVFCPDYKPDWYVQCLMDAITELRAAVPEDVRKDAFEDAAQRCRYYLKHQNYPTSWNDKDEFQRGVQIACENLEKIMLEESEKPSSNMNKEQS